MGKTASPSVALCAADSMQLHAMASYLLELEQLDRCSAYRDGVHMVEDMERGVHYDAIIVDEKLRDMDALGLLALLQTCRIAERPIVIVVGSPGYLRHMDFYGTHLADVLLSKPFPPHRLVEQLYMFCALKKNGVVETVKGWLREWGVEEDAINSLYFAHVIQVSKGKLGHMALRKEVLPLVAEKYGVSPLAVDTGIRRLIDQLEREGTPAYRMFKRQTGLGEQTPKVKQMLYACGKFYDMHTWTEG